MKSTLIAGAAALVCTAAFAQGTPPAEGGAAAHAQAPGPGAGGCPMMGQGMMGKGMMGGQGMMGQGMMGGHGQGMRSRGPRDPYALLDLSDDQRKKILAIREEARRKIGDLRRQTANARDEAHNRIAALLTPEQRSQLRRQGPPGPGGDTK